MINFLVTGLNSLVGQAIIKSIVNSNLKSYKIYSTDYVENKLFSKHIDKFFYSPDIFKNKSISEDSFINFFIQIIIKNKIDFFLVGVDFELKIFSKYKEHIQTQANVKLIIMDYKIISFLKNKFLLQKKFKQKKLNYIESYNWNDFDNKKIKPKFPLIYRPKDDTSSKNISFLNNKKDLKHIKKNRNFFFQSLISSEFEYTSGISTFNNNDFNILTLKRVLKNGDTIRAINDKSSNIYNEYLLQVYKALNLWGPVNIQFKVLNKKVYIFEINPRFSGTTFMRSLFGFNQIDQMIDEMINNKIYKHTKVYGEIYRFYDEEKI